jgi:radical SAM protein with 4Fe4S-binding SPASM domain
MFLLSNRFPEKLIIHIANLFYRNIPYGKTLFLRRFFSSCLNIYSNFSKILKYGMIDMFDGLSIETTTYCNRKCSYCPNSVFDRGSKKNEKLIPVELFKKIIDELKDINFKGRINPNLYGETLLDERLPELMTYIHKKLPEAKLTIYTNGDFLDMDMLNKLYECGVRSYIITIHGNVKEGREKIKKLMRYIKQGRKKIKILCQVMNENTPLSNIGGLVKVKNIKKEDFDCIDPLAINYKGDVIICCNDYFGEVVFGNLEKEKIIDIWNKTNFRQIRQQLKKRIYILDICKRCVNLESIKKK